MPVGCYSTMQCVRVSDITCVSLFRGGAKLLSEDECDELCSVADQPFLCVTPTPSPFTEVPACCTTNWDETRTNTKRSTERCAQQEGTVCCLVALHVLDWDMSPFDDRSFNLTRGPI